MCDYSLHLVESRPAEVGDKLVTTSFQSSITRGFAAVGEPNVAVCLLPGSELAFDQDVTCEGVLSFLSKRKMRQSLARFRQVNLDNPCAHHDALEFPNGNVALVTNLCEGQIATVLQLPVGTQVQERAKIEEPAALQDPVLPLLR